MTDIKPNEDDKKPEEKPVVTPTDLDAVHEKAQHDIDNEEPVDEVVPEEKEEPVIEKPEEKPEEDAPVQVPEEPKEEPVVVPPIEEEPEKVSIKDSDGKIQEFASIKDIPDDFEPFSYKEFAVGINKLTELGLEQKQSAKQKAEEDAKAERDARIDKIKEGWQKDQDALIKQGLIPAEEEKNQPIIDGVFTVMQEEMNNNGTTLGFKTAYEIYAHRESLKVKDEEIKAKNDEKKRRGAFVQPGGSTTPSAPSKKGKVFEAPPTGMSLDQVHENVLGSLQLIFRPVCA